MIETDYSTESSLVLSDTATATTGSNKILKFASGMLANTGPWLLLLFSLLLLQ